MLVPVTRRLRQSNPAAVTVALNQLLMERSKMSVLTDVRGVVQEFPPVAAGSLGYLPVDLRGRPFLDLAHPDDRAALQQALQQPELSFPNTAIRLMHGGRKTAVSVEMTIGSEANGMRIVLADVASWRAVDWAVHVVKQVGATDGTRTIPTIPRPPTEHSLGFVMCLDRQCALVAANTTWQELTGVVMNPGPGSVIGPSTWMHAFDQEMIGRFGRSLPEVRAGNAFQSTGCLIDRDGFSRPIVITACSVDGGTSGFVVLGFETGPLVETVIPPTAPSADLGDSECTDEPQPEVEVPKPLAVQEPDQHTQAIIASVLSAARAEDRQPFHNDAGPDCADGEDFEETPEPVSWPVLAAPLDQTAQGPDTELIGNAKQLLADHLQALHHDGLDAVVSTALLLIKIELTPGSKDDEAYEMGVLERRLRASIRDHEYADRHDLRGFVVAARGGFGHAELEALALRLANRLRAPLRGHSSTDLLSLTVAAVRSGPGESDHSLIERVQSESRYATDRGLSVHIARNDR